MVRGGDAASMDELVGATVGDLLVEDSLLEDRGVAECLVHLAAEQLEEEGPLVAGLVNAAGLGYRKSHRIKVEGV